MDEEWSCFSRGPRAAGEPEPLDGNEKGPAGRQALAEAMLLNTTLRELDIVGILPGQSL
jgi:hypothetical protein